MAAWAPTIMSAFQPLDRRILPFHIKTHPGNCTHHSCLYSNACNLITWLHLAGREAGKCSFILNGYKPNRKTRVLRSGKKGRTESRGNWQPWPHSLSLKFIRAGMPTFVPLHHCWELIAASSCISTPSLPFLCSGHPTHLLASGPSHTLPLLAMSHWEPSPCLMW